MYTRTQPRSTLLKRILWWVLGKVFGLAPLPRQISRALRKADARVCRQARRDAINGTTDTVPAFLHEVSEMLAQIIVAYMAGRRAWLVEQLGRLREARPDAGADAFAVPVAGFTGASADRLAEVEPEVVVLQEDYLRTDRERRAYCAEHDLPEVRPPARHWLPGTATLGLILAAEAVMTGLVLQDVSPHSRLWRRRRSHRLVDDPAAGARHRRHRRQ